MLHATLFPLTVGSFRTTIEIDGLSVPAVIRNHHL